jgi:hypothetical protein
MKTNRQVATNTKTYIDDESEKFHTHIHVFRGIKTGVVIVFFIFWFPFFCNSLFLGWLYALTYGVSLLVLCTVLGIISRHYGLHNPSTIQNHLLK